MTTASWNLPYNQAIRTISAAVGAGCTIIIKCAEVSGCLIDSPVVRKISFTGSVPVGKHLAALAGARMKRATRELGGDAQVP